MLKMIKLFLLEFALYALIKTLSGVSIKRFNHISDFILFNVYVEIFIALGIKVISKRVYALESRSER